MPMDMPSQTDALSPALLRKIWFTIDTAASSSLLLSNDGELADGLVARLQHSSGLTPEESFEVKRYVCARAHLIRDLVQQA